MAYKSIRFRAEVSFDLEALDRQRNRTRGLPALLVILLWLLMSVGIAAAAEDRPEVSSRHRIPRKKSTLVVVSGKHNAASHPLPDSAFSPACFLTCGRFSERIKP